MKKIVLILVGLLVIVWLTWASRGFSDEPLTITINLQLLGGLITFMLVTIAYGYMAAMQTERDRARHADHRSS